jgi:peptidoglycan-N-acetylglucosamine deacetylase
MKAKKALPVILLFFSLAVVAAVLFKAPWYIFAVIIFITLLVFVYGSAYIGSGFYIDVICNARGAAVKQHPARKEKAKMIALTFDDGPDCTVTPAVLQVLGKYNVKATFFCAGKNILKNPELVKKIDNDGHIIGNHSFSHHYLFDIFPKKQMTNEIRVTGNLIWRNTGKRPLLFRPPYGVTNPVLAVALKGTAYKAIGWSLKSRDTTNKNKDSVTLRLKKRLQEGDIILFHDTLGHLPAILDGFLEYVNEKGYRAVRIDELLNIKAYE